MRPGDRKNNRVGESRLEPSSPGLNYSTDQEAGTNYPSAFSIQTKLTVNRPGDKYEREADRIASQIMHKPEGHFHPSGVAFPGIQRSCSCGGSCPKCRAGREEQLSKTPLMRKFVHSGEGGASPALAGKLHASKHRGNPLPQAVNQSMSRAMGSDFSRVRVHTDTKAAQMNREVHAKAFTHGSDIYFNQGQYQPHTGEGKRLLAHELVHVVQQSGMQTGAEHIQRQSSQEPSFLPTSCENIIATKTYSRGNNDGVECQYETARITVDLIADPCVCNNGTSTTFPLFVNYSAVLQGKRFTGGTIPNPSGTGTIQEQEGQASAIATGVITPGRSRPMNNGVPIPASQLGLRLEETGTTPTNASANLTLSVDDNNPGGIPGDPGDVISQRLRLNASLPCFGGSTSGTVNLGGGFQVIDYQATGSWSIMNGDISLSEPVLPPGRISTPLRDLSVSGTSPYPTFPGTPRGANCTCNTITGRHQGAGCTWTTGSATVGTGSPTGTGTGP
ncbi:MAG: DUF4157 domain-containing protein [Lewinella sp.]|nr:DUF4157 domain-containing protein [Lewinella sp.]